MGSFAELTRQVHLLNDLILSDLGYSKYLDLFIVTLLYAISYKITTIIN